MVLTLAAEGIRQPRVAPKAHADGQILALGKAGADVPRIGIADHGLGFAADALRRAIAFLRLCRLSVDFHQMA